PVPQTVSSKSTREIGFVRSRHHPAPRILEKPPNRSRSPSGPSSPPMKLGSFRKPPPPPSGLPERPSKRSRPQAALPSPRAKMGSFRNAHPRIHPVPPATLQSCPQKLGSFRRPPPPGLRNSRKTAQSIPFPQRPFKAAHKNWVRFAGRHR